MDLSDYSYLDQVRIEEGYEKCRSVFSEISQSDRQQAADLLNDTRMTFPGLFILEPEITANKLYRHLDSRNITVFNIISQIVTQQNTSGNASYLSKKNREIYSALKWILETGHTEDGINDEYESVMDVSVSVLINVYKDKNILPAVVDMIFSRNKKGHYIHDLVWAFFRISDPDALKLIAKYIISPDREDMELACNLLNLEPLYRDGISADLYYQNYIEWLDENGPFLYFTGESYQFSSRPIFYNVDFEKKYLCRINPPNIIEASAPLYSRENQSLEAFRLLSEEDKHLLSDYSYKIYKQDYLKWRMWLQSPISEQIIAASGAPEVLS